MFNHFTLSFKLLIAGIIFLVIDGLLVANQYQTTKQVEQLQQQVAFSEITPTVIPTETVTATPSATLAPIVKTPVRVVTLAPTK